MRVEIDTHTHTLASGHAYNTMNEMAKAAADKGLKGLAITEHAPEMPGTCHLYYFQNLRIVPRKRFGIELLLGTELNIMNAEGKVDLSEDVLKTLPVDMKRLVSKAKKTGTLLEVNNSSLRPDGFRENTKENCLRMVKECKEQGVMIVLGSDSHVDADIAEYPYAEEILKKANFPEELIANLSLEKLKACIKYGKKL